MADKPTILSYGKTAGISIHLSQDGTVFDAEIQPSLSDFKTSLIVGGILGYMPFAILYFYTRQLPNVLLLLIAATILFSVILGVVYALSVATKTNTRIHADREQLSMDQYTASTSFSRRWDRDEVRRVRAKWLGFDKNSRWGVVIDLPLVQACIVQGLIETEAQSIAEGIRTVLDVPESDEPFKFKAPTPPDLPDIDVPIRHGVIVDRSPHRLTIIVPATGPFASLQLSPEALIEVDRHMLYVDSADPVQKQEGHRRRRSWPRTEITSIKGDLYGMGLIVRVAGKEMYELLNQSPEDLRVWIARTLNDELKKPQHSPVQARY